MTLGSTPKLSVLMPSYNHQDYVLDAVRSVLDSKDAQNLELIVVDDGSTDQTLERLSKVDDPRLKLVRQDNQGAHNAFNRALDLARGELVFLLNSDDRFAPDRLRRLANELANRPEVVAASSWIRLIGPDDKELGIKEAWSNMPPWPTAGPCLADLNQPRAAFLQTNWAATTSNVVFKTSQSSVPPRFRNLRYCHDWDFILQLARLGDWLLIDEPLVDYRVHPKNTLKEGADSGKAQMELEILWVFVCHASPLLKDLEHGAQTPTDDQAASPQREARTPTGFNDEAQGQLREARATLGLSTEHRRTPTGFNKLPIADLQSRFWNGRPRFPNAAGKNTPTKDRAIDSVLNRLAVLRGNADTPDAFFLDLLEEENKVRQSLLRLLQSGDKP